MKIVETKVEIKQESSSTTITTELAAPLPIEQKR